MRLLLGLCVVLASLSLGACYSGQPAPGGGPGAAPSVAPGATAPTPGKACGGGGKA